MIRVIIEITKAISDIKYECFLLKTFFTLYLSPCSYSFNHSNNAIMTIIIAARLSIIEKVINIAANFFSNGVGLYNATSTIKYGCFSLSAFFTSSPPLLSLFLCFMRLRLFHEQKASPHFY